MVSLQARRSTCRQSKARGEPIDARSDLFSLGCVLYAMCTGHSPFRAETTYGVLHRITNDKPTPVCEVNSDVPAWLGHVIERLMAKRPEDRFESATQVADLLEAVWLTFSNLQLCHYLKRSMH